MTKHKKKIYLDHSAATPVDPEVLEAMRPYFSEKFGNASSPHRQARLSAKGVQDARRSIARILECEPSELIFASSGTESDNLAIRGVAWAAKLAEKGNHIITSAVEHHAVGNTVRQLCEVFGFQSTVIPVDEYGLVDPADVERAILPETVLISVMAANNEVGTLQPVAEIGEIAERRGIPFHSDAVQGAGFLEVRPGVLKTDLLTFSSHKFYGPKGCGLLYAKKGSPLLPQITGGPQERVFRAGTENVPAVAGFSKAFEKIRAAKDETSKFAVLRDRLIERILDRIPGSKLTGHPERRLPGHASFVFEGVEADGLLMRLDLAGVCASSGSACNTGMPEPSYVLLAMGLPPELALGALRLTLGKSTKSEDIDAVLEILPPIVKKLRE